jgi:hypothetical protein
MSKYEGLLELPVVGDDVVPGRFTEKIVAESLGLSRFRVLRSPGAVEGLAEGDIIELSADERGFRVVERSGNLCIWVYASRHDPTAVPGLDPALGERLLSMGGRVRQASRAHWVVTLPVVAGFGKIARVFDDAVVAGLVGCWFYGNVYAAHTGGAPLEWWNDERFYP